MRLQPLMAAILVIAAAITAFGQTTEFTYQGQLQSSSTPASGVYDFEFVLFDAASGGVQSTPVLPRSSVTVTNGIFSVILDFGVAGFLGPARYLEIRVREAGGGVFTTLGPRQIVSSSPYSIRSLIAATATNSQSLGGVAANQFVQTNDLRLTDPRPPTAGSTNYIQNSASSQGVANFSITGNGTVAGTLSGTTVNAVTQFNLDGTRFLSVGGTPSNLFAGFGAGSANTGGTLNTFVGENAGNANTSGFNNTFVGSRAGQSITTNGNNSFFGSGAGSEATGSANSFFGVGAGRVNTGTGNSFFGNLTGSDNTSGIGNSFYGSNAGFLNTTGSNNTFLGNRAGQQTTIGGNNTFVGENSGFATSSGVNNVAVGKGAGTVNTTGSNNTLIGYNAEPSSGGLSFAAAIGAGAEVSNSNSVVLGRSLDTVRVPGSLSVTGGTDAELGAGGYIVAGQPTGANLVLDTNEVMARNGLGTATLFLNAEGGDVNLVQNGGGNVGIAVAGTPLDKLHVDGIIRVSTLGAAGATSLCRNAAQQISTCSSSLRYKTNFSMYRGGLGLIDRLKPITFDWKTGGLHDLGLGAEDVASIEPLLVTYNAKGEVEGVKYDRIGVVLINAVKEQQAQIQTQQEQIELLIKANRDAAKANETLRSRLTNIEQKLTKRTSGRRR